MADTRRANVNWNLPEGVNSWDAARLAVLMDIRDELRTLNAVFRCHNALAIPQLLREIKKNTTKKPRRKKTAR